MAYTPIELEKNGDRKIATSPGEEAQLRWDGWLPLGTTPVIPPANRPLYPSDLAPTVLSDAATREAVVDVVEDSDLDLTGAVNFAQSPTVDGMPLGGGVVSVNGNSGIVNLDADDIPESSSRSYMTTSERAKLAAVAEGATTNAADAILLDRANHTGTQTAATIADLREAVEDYVAALLANGTNVTLQYIDNGEGAGSLVIDAVAGNELDPEAVRDIVGVAMVGVGAVSVAVNDAGDTIVISTTATVNATDAALRDRATHTGTQSAATITETATIKMLTAAERTKLAGIAGGATANATDAALRDRATHTGTQAMSTVSGLGDAIDELAPKGLGLYNILHYGAAGDNSTNDAPAIQGALDDAEAAGGGIVLIPGGRTYAVADYLYIGANTTILAYGATIRASANTGLTRNFRVGDSAPGYTGKGNIFILGGTWDANAADGVTGTVTVNTNAINFNHATNCHVRDVTVLNVSSAHAVEFNSVDNGSATNCRFLGFRDNSGNNSRQFAEAVQIDCAASGSSTIGPWDGTTSRNIRVEGCFMGPSSRLGPFGRLTGSHTLPGGAFYDNIKVVNNHVEGSLADAIYGLAWRRATVEGNTIISPAGTGIKMVSGPTSATSDLTIRGNIIRNPGGSAIQVLGVSGARASRVIIANNNGSAIGTTSVHYGVQVEQCINPRVSDNIFDTSSGTLIYILDSVEATVNGNTLYNSGSNGINFTGCTAGTASDNDIIETQSNSGVYGSNSTRISVRGNRIIGAAAYGIRQAPGCTGWSVLNNMVRKSTAHATELALGNDASSTGSVYAGNDFSGNSWTNAALVVAPGSKMSFTGSTTLPGDNIL